MEYNVPDSTKNQMAEWYKSSEKLTEIARQFGYSYGLSRSIIIETLSEEVYKKIAKSRQKENGQKKAEKQYIFFSKKKQIQIIKFAKDGMILGEIGKKFGCSWSKIRSILIENIGMKQYTELAKKHIREKWISSWEKCFIKNILLPHYSNYEIKQQFYLKNFNHAYDIAIPDLKLLIEIDCSYWHKDRKERDAQIDEFARQAGWKIYRFNDKKLKECGILS